MTIFEYWTYSRYKMEQAQMSPEARLANVHEDLLRRLPSRNSEQTEMIETLLNEIVLHDKAKTLSEEFYKNLETYGGEAYEGEQVTETFSASYRKLGSMWAQYSALSKEASTTAAEIDASINSSGLSPEQFKKTIFQKRQKLNNITGRMFENLLQMSIPLLSMAEIQTTDEVVNELIKSVGAKTSVIKTQGSSKASRIIYTIDSEQNKVSVQGTGKVDVSLSGNGMFPDFNISAKSYANGYRDVSLFTGKLVPLIAQWPTSSSNLNYFYNALREDEGTYLQATRLVLAIQSLIGASGMNNENALADLLILYNRSHKTHPITVYSTRQIIMDVLKSQNIDLTIATFPMKLKTLPISGYEHDAQSLEIEQGYGAAAQSLIIETKLNRAYLSVSALSKFKKKFI